MERRPFREGNRVSSFENRKPEYRTQNRKFFGGNSNKRFVRKNVSPATGTVGEDKRSSTTNGFDWSTSNCSETPKTSEASSKREEGGETLESTLREMKSQQTTAKATQLLTQGVEAEKESSQTPSVTPSPASPPPSPCQSGERPVLYREFFQLQNDITKSRVEIQSLRSELLATNGKLDEVCKQLQDLRRELDMRFEVSQSSLMDRKGNIDSVVGIESHMVRVNEIGTRSVEATSYDAGEIPSSGKYMTKSEYDATGAKYLSQQRAEVTGEGWLYCCRKGEKIPEILDILELQGCLTHEINIPEWILENNVRSHLGELADVLNEPVNISSNDKVWDVASRVIAAACKKDTFLFLKNCDTVATVSPGTPTVKARINLAYFIQTIARVWERLERENANCLGRIVVVLEGWPKDRVIGNHKVEELP
eukprot:jgi/Galph1/3109/GphlegSOOS_G1760.1